MPELDELFPEKITDYRCPACGKKMVGGSFDLDAERKQCTKRVHKAMPVKQQYVKTGPVKGYHDA